jgi:hypothetical protein
MLAPKNARVLSSKDKKKMQKCVMASVQTITNPLASKYLKYFDGRVNFSELFPYDKLHTFYKGILQNAICWVISLVFVTSMFHPNKGDFVNSLGLLDERIKKFCRHNCCHPFKNFHFDGVSHFFKDSKKKKDCLLKGVMSVCGLPAYQLAALLWQVMYMLLLYCC